MKKRILPILLALIMALTLLPTLALADEPANKVLIAGNNQEFTTLEAAVKEAEAGDTIYADASMTETVEVVIDGTGVNTLQAKIDAADPGAEIDLGGKYYPENLSINKSITLKNGTIDTATVIGASNLEFNNITFVNASNVINLDTNPAALYLQSVENVRVENCTFMAPANATGTTIGITTVTTENVGIINCTITGYGITAYHNPGTSNVTYEGNFIAGSKSGIAFVGTDTVLVDGNTFENANGIRVEPSWADGALCDTVVIENNSFIDTPEGGYAVRVQNSSGEAGYEGALKLNENYWGTDDPADIFALIKGDALVENYYPTADKDPDSIVELDTTLVYTSEQLIEAIADAKEDAVITLAPGTYDGNIRFDDKSLTIKAQYPANPESGNSPTKDQLSIFAGTFNTSEGTNDADFNAEQYVTIDGIAFEGDGLKVGNTNYNTVGNLIVKNCTMECGQNLEKADNYNKYNYFVKVSGNAGAPYAKVTVFHNNVTGTPDDLVTPIQLWDVYVANVSDNMIVLNDAEGHQAINISKMAENATVIVKDNVIANATGGIYVTTWLLGGTGECAFTGDIDVVDNDMFDVDTPIYIGYEESTEPYGSLDASCSIADENNTNNGEPVVADIIQKPGEAPVTYVVTVKDGQSIVDMRSVVAGAEYKLPAAPTKPGYIFMGWKCSDSHTHQANETVTVEKDMTFTAVWSNLPDIEPGTPVVPDEPVVGDFPFTDVSVNAWYYEAVKYVYENGIMNGMDRYSFQPNGTLTRAMVWTMLARLDGVDTEGGNSWYAKAQEWATANGVSDGENPTGEVTREQLVTMLYRYAQYKGYDVSIGEDTNILSYVDVDQVSDWAMEAFQWACGTGVIEGDENSALTPKASTTRAQAAAMFMRFIEL